jgi:hypothetical protein
MQFFLFNKVKKVLTIAKNLLIYAAFFIQNQNADIRGKVKDCQYKKHPIAGVFLLVKRQILP